MRGGVDKAWIHFEMLPLLCHNNFLDSFAIQTANSDVGHWWFLIYSMALCDLHYCMEKPLVNAAMLSKFFNWHVVILCS